jgi:hypothetical protein
MLARSLYIGPLLTHRIEGNQVFISSYLAIDDKARSMTLEALIYCMMKFRTPIMFSMDRLPPITFIKSSCGINREKEIERKEEKKTEGFKFGNLIK